MQTPIRCMLMRGGSSKGLYFRADDLPADASLRDRVLVAAMGADARQIDGSGGAHRRTSKAAIGVLGAVSVATACILPGSVADGIATVPGGAVKHMSVEHPSGEFSVTLEVGGTAERPAVLKAGLLRTARLIMRGKIFVPARVWDGSG